MKALFIAAVLLAAAGGAVYLYKELHSTIQSTAADQLVIGKWKFDSVVTSGKDSLLLTKELSFHKAFRKDNIVELEFTPGGEIYSKSLDTALVLKYEWVEATTFIIESRQNDSLSRQRYKVAIDSSQLRIQSSDSNAAYFTKLPK